LHDRTSTLPLLKGKKAFVTGIANDQSIAHVCAKALRAFGADLGITFLNEKARPYVEPLGQSTMSVLRWRFCQ
jgi:enoyl-[acyl-carrier protein] reductase I